MQQRNVLQQLFSTEWVQFLDWIFDNIADGITFIDYKGAIRRQNKVARQIYLTLLDSPGAKLTLEALLQAPLRRILEGEEVPESMVQVMDAHGEGRDYLVLAYPLPPVTTLPGPLQDAYLRSLTGEQPLAGAIVIWHAMNEHCLRESEQQAREHADYLEAILEAITDAVFVFDQQGCIVKMNTAAQTLLARIVPPETATLPMRERLAGVKITNAEEQLLSPEQWPMIRILQGERFTSDQAVEMQMPTRDGGVQIISVTGGPIRDASGQITGAAAISHDITEQKRTERKARAEREAQFKKSERLKDEFIEIASHELRDPLAVLKGYTQMLLMQSKRGRGPEFTGLQKQMLQEIDNSINSLVELANDLLDVTRLQAGELVLRFEPTDLVALARRVTERLQMTTVQHTLSIESTLPSLPLSLDVRRMEQVFSNVIGNAIKYSPDGGAIEIAIREACEAQEVVTSIRDHGIGIPLHEQGRIFGRFARAANAGAYRIGGTGLGLYLCRELVKRHAGDIWFESVQGQGSTFFIALPLNSDNRVN